MEKQFHIKNYSIEEIRFKKDKLENLREDFEEQFNKFLKYKEQGISEEELKEYFEIAKNTLNEAIEINEDLSEDDNFYSPSLYALPDDLKYESDLEYILDLFEYNEELIEDVINDIDTKIVKIYLDNIGKNVFEDENFKPAYKDGYEIEIIEKSDDMIRVEINKEEYSNPEEIFDLISEALADRVDGFDMAIIEDDETNEPICSAFYYTDIDSDGDLIYYFYNAVFNKDIEDTIKWIKNNIPESIFNLYELNTNESVSDIYNNSFVGSDIIDHLPSNKIESQTVSKSEIKKYEENPSF
jgi:hypothetical protein